MKRQLRNLIAGACRCSGLLALAERCCASELTILCYHRVLPIEMKRAYPMPDLVVTPEAFRRHCEVLREHFDVLPITEALSAARAKGSVTRPIAVITFDDGYWDNHAYAASVLNDCGLLATFYVVSSVVGTHKLLWHDIAARQGAEMVRELKRQEPEKRRKQIGHLAERLETLDPQTGSDDRLMSWTEVRELIDAGHEIGAHTRTHELLPQLDDDCLQSEVIDCKVELEEKVGRTVPAFCYPNGDHDGRVCRVVSRAGFTSAVTMKPGTNSALADAFRLQRWFIHEDRLTGWNDANSAALLRMELCGLSQDLFRRGDGGGA